MSAKNRESIVLMNIIDILKKDTSCLPHECKVWAVASEYKNWPNFLPIVIASCARYRVIYDHEMLIVYSVDENKGCVTRLMFRALYL